MTTTQLQNKDGEWVEPSLESFSEAAAAGRLEGRAAEHATWCSSTSPARTTWPITGASFILVQKDQADAARAKAMLEFFDWAFTERRRVGREPRLRADPRERLRPRRERSVETVTAGGTPVWPLSASLG